MARRSRKALDLVMPVDSGSNDVVSKNKAITQLWRLQNAKIEEGYVTPRRTFSDSAAGFKELDGGDSVDDFMKAGASIIRTNEGHVLNYQKISGSTDSKRRWELGWIEEGTDYIYPIGTHNPNKFSRRTIGGGSRVEKSNISANDVPLDWAIVDTAFCKFRLFCWLSDNKLYASYQDEETGRDIETSVLVDSPTGTYKELKVVSVDGISGAVILYRSSSANVIWSVKVTHSAGKLVFGTPVRLNSGGMPFATIGEWDASSSTFAPTTFLLVYSDTSSGTIWVRGFDTNGASIGVSSTLGTAVTGSGVSVTRFESAGSELFFFVYETASGIEFQVNDFLGTTTGFGEFTGMTGTFKNATMLYNTEVPQFVVGVTVRYGANNQYSTAFFKGDITAFAGSYAYLGDIQQNIQLVSSAFALDGVFSVYTSGAGFDETASDDLVRVGALGLALTVVDDDEVVYQGWASGGNSVISSNYEFGSAPSNRILVSAIEMNSGFEIPDMNFFVEPLPSGTYNWDLIPSFLRVGDREKNLSYSEGASGAAIAGTQLTNLATKSAPHFIYRPPMFVDAEGSSSGSSWSYAVITEAINPSGEIVRSSPMISEFFTKEDIEIRVLPYDEGCGFERVVYKVYRTTDDGSTYRLHSVYDQSDVTNGVISFTDSVTDSNLLSGEVIYSDFQDTSQFPVDPFPGASSVISTEERLFWISSEYPERVYFTFPKQGGREYETNRSFYILLESGGPNIALSKLNGIPVVFKENSIWAIEGSGPDAFGRGGQFQANRIVDGVGVSSRQRVVGTPDGIFFLAEDGLRFLSRERGVANLTNALKLDVVHGSYFDHARSEVYFLSDDYVYILDDKMRISTWSNESNPSAQSGLVYTPTSIAIHDGTIYGIAADGASGVGSTAKMLQISTGLSYLFVETRHLAEQEFPSNMFLREVGLQGLWDSSNAPTGYAIYDYDEYSGGSPDSLDSPSSPETRYVRWKPSRGRIRAVAFGFIVPLPSGADEESVELENINIKLYARGKVLPDSGEKGA